MSSITTAEEIQKQLSIIFGFHSARAEEIQVGDIIGVGKLTKQKINNLVFEMLKFLNAYNGMLRDYSGSEIFAMEFTLKHRSREKTDYSIMPKSMILIPGEYKDCNTLLLALTQETGILDVFNAKEDLDDIGKLFFEIEEVVNRPELNVDEKKNVLNKFAWRFTRKIQAYLMEGKWNKKLVGIKTFSPIEQDYIKRYLEIQSKYEIFWSNPIKNIKIGNPRFIKPRINYGEKDKLEYMKWCILPHSAYYIIQNTLQLAANLLQIANTGTINEIQELLFKHFINEVKDLIIEQESKGFEFNKIIPKFNQAINSIEKELLNFENKAINFCKSGEKLEYGTLIKKLEDELKNYSKINANTKSLTDILLRIINEDEFNHEASIRSIELKGCVDYLIELAKSQLKLIKENFQKYLSFSYLFLIFERFIANIKQELDSEQQPTKILGYRFLSKLAFLILNEICEKTIYLNDFNQFDRKRLETYFKEVVTKTINKNIDDIPIYIEDLIRFAESMLGSQLKNVEKYTKNLKEARKQFEFLLGFIFRNSNYNNFIKQMEEEIVDPETLAQKFHEFIRKRMGGLNIYWKEYVLDLILEFGIVNQPKYLEDLDNKKPWSKAKIFNLFIEFIEKKITSLLDPKNFIEVLDNYIAKIQNPTEQAIMVILFEQYEYSLSILEEFPSYFKQKLSKSLAEVNYDSAIPNNITLVNNFQIESLYDLNIFNNREIEILKEINCSYLDFLKKFEMEYFSKLVALPTRLILKNINNISFSGPLYTIFEFKFLERFFKTSIFSNWERIKLNI
ncbi:MAG: hypothetical protein ACTSO9_00070 [Candidatus Helarchaeota archaeon]